MTKNKRGLAEDQERAVSTMPTQKWWVGVLLWVLAAVAIGAIYRLTAPVFGVDDADKMFALRLAVTLALNATAMYGISYFAARQTLARRSLREIWKLESNRSALNRFGLPIVLSVAGLAFLVATESVTESLFHGLLALSTVFCLYRALTTAYTSHFFDYVASPLEMREMENDREIKGKKRLVWERIAVVAGLNYPRQRLVFPLLQTLLVAFGLQSIVSVALSVSGVDLIVVSSSVAVGAIAPALPVISVVLWGIWHLNGGAGRILHLSSGRPMKSFGWQHPELAGSAK